MVFFGYAEYTSANIGNLGEGGVYFLIIIGVHMREVSFRAEYRMINYKPYKYFEKFINSASVDLQGASPYQVEEFLYSLCTGI